MPYGDGDNPRVLSHIALKIDAAIDLMPMARARPATSWLTHTCLQIVF